MIPIQTSAKLKQLWQPADYKILYGGRGSGKSWGVADYLIVQALNEQSPGTYLCVREFQTSMADSVYSQLVDKIYTYGLASEFVINKTELICKPTGIKFVFLGMRKNPQSVKSMYNLKKVWAEEAQTLSKESLTLLLPTIREDGSEFIATYNPYNDDDPIHELMVDPLPNTIKIKLNWSDNPWFTQRMRIQMEALKKKDYDLYLHVWEGHTYNRSEAQVFWDLCVIEEFQPLKTWHGPYYGLDWGFANDPLRLVRCWIADRKLWIEKEVSGLRVDIDKTPKYLLSGDPFCDRYVIRADNARPESISYCQQNGFPKMVACKKGPNSVEEGITFVRSFDNIIIHPACKHTTEEARLYSYKIDRMSGDVLPDVVDAYNHSWDAIRYSLEPIMPKKGQKGSITVKKG